MLPWAWRSEWYSCSSSHWASSWRSVPRYDGPRLRRQETSWTAWAPAMTDWTTSVTVWTPPLQASEAFTFGESRASQTSRSGSSAELDRCTWRRTCSSSTSMSGW